jgi:hypothetical protein
MNLPQIPTSVLLTEIYGELGKGLGWSLNRSNFHTELFTISDTSNSLFYNAELSKYLDELENIVQENKSTLLTDLNERKHHFQSVYIELNKLLLRILRQRTNIARIEGACEKDIQNTIINTGIVYFLEDEKICDDDSVRVLNHLIATHPNIKEICCKLLFTYTKTIITTDTLIKCIMMARMTEQLPEPNERFDADAIHETADAIQEIDE